MPRSLRIAYLVHSVRSDWNNGNAHFLRGLIRNMAALGHDVTIYEPAHGWSIDNLLMEPGGTASLQQFAAVYPQLDVHSYSPQNALSKDYWKPELQDCEIVILHEWNSPQLAQCMLALRDELGFALLFHDTHHRASSSPEAIAAFGVDRFDGVLAFGEALRDLYVNRYGVMRAWTLHEAADTAVFHPMPTQAKAGDVIWVGNWGDDERKREICEFLLRPAAQLRRRRFCVYGVRYPEEALAQLEHSGVSYEGYLPNLNAASAYGSARLTVHIPRQQYVQAMKGIPTIRVFEALACGIPLISAPWPDSEHLFRDGDFITARNTAEMCRSIEYLLMHPREAEAQALRGLETVLAQHTCRHRAEQLTSICEELIA
jgi:spore maturation protein CgeB